MTAESSGLPANGVSILQIDKLFSSFSCREYRDFENSKSYELGVGIDFS